jgi:hypothetical protein
LGIGDWGLGIGPNPQSPIPNPQSPIPNPHFPNFQKLKNDLILIKKIVFYIFKITIKIQNGKRNNFSIF